MTKARSPSEANIPTDATDSSTVSRKNWPLPILPMSADLKARAADLIKQAPTGPKGSKLRRIQAHPADMLPWDLPKPLEIALIAARLPADMPTWHAAMRALHLLAHATIARGFVLQKRQQFEANAKHPPIPFKKALRDLFPKIRHVPKRVARVKEAQLQALCLSGIKISSPNTPAQFVDKIIAGWETNGIPQADYRLLRSAIAEYDQRELSKDQSNRAKGPRKPKKKTQETS